MAEGGCYYEYAAICELEKKIDKKIFYGGSNIINEEELISDL